MRTLVLISAIVFSSFSFSNDKIVIDKKACKYVQERISLIEKFHSLEEGYSFELLSASKFLSKITSFKSKSKYSYKSIGDAKENDINTWKTWFEGNKHLLYWDDQLKTVRVR
ncbi:MAG: hypothetical protein HRT69_09745 [Flavobacteriaceae bacterium]|nr:hypothetical protein [Flavobacteriaceae bacterium]